MNKLSNLDYNCNKIIYFSSIFYCVIQTNRIFNLNYLVMAEYIYSFMIGKMALMEEVE